LLLDVRTGPPAPPPITSCPIELVCENQAGKAFKLLAEAKSDRDISKDTPVGSEYDVIWQFVAVC
jgi:hypothetical protein